MAELTLAQELDLIDALHIQFGAILSEIDLLDEITGLEKRTFYLNYRQRKIDLSSRDSLFPGTSRAEVEELAYPAEHTTRLRRGIRESSERAARASSRGGTSGSEGTEQAAARAASTRQVGSGFRDRHRREANELRKQLRADIYTRS